MRKFAEAYRDASIVQELLAQITWYHHIALLDKVKDAKERDHFVVTGNISGVIGIDRVGGELIHFFQYTV
jgi:hypothetical protein